MKKFSRIRQWAEEKIKKSHVNLPSEEFKDFQNETKRRHEDYDDLRRTMTQALHHIKKSKVASDNGHLKSPIGDFGDSILRHASMFPRDCVYWSILTSFGLGECRLAEAEGGLAEDTKDHYITLLQEFSMGYKHYQTICRKLESRRLDYDANYKRLQKAKKEDPGTEQLVQTAKMKYEKSELDVVTSMISLQKTEVKHCEALQRLLNLQLAYHREATNILENVEYEWDQWTRNCKNEEDSPLTIKCSQFNACEGVNGIGAPILRRALYDHVPNQDDELSFHVDDIITVLHKVDDSWWLGELINKDNQRIRGIFPVSYTERYTVDHEIGHDRNDSNIRHSINNKSDKSDTSPSSSLLRCIPHHIDHINTRPPKRSFSDGALFSPSSLSSLSPTSIQSVTGYLPSSQADDESPTAPITSEFSRASFEPAPPPTPIKTKAFIKRQLSTTSDTSSYHSSRSTLSSIRSARQSPGLELLDSPTLVTPQQTAPLKSGTILPPPTGYYGRPLPPKPLDD